MLKNFIFFIFLFSLMACSPSKKISRNYLGEGREVLFEEFGEPQKVLELKNGHQQFIYVKEQYIHETNIGIGRTTLDPRVSPGFIKEETFRFELDGEGIIVGTDYEKKQK